MHTDTQTDDRNRVPEILGNRLTRTLSDIDLQHSFEWRPELADFVNWSENVDSPIHRWYKYREGYSSRLITELDLGQRILDPFCGCGSMMVGAAQLDRASRGIDVNPLAIFAARVKLTPLSPNQLCEIECFTDEIEALAATADPWPTPRLNISHKVFEPVILDTLMRIRFAIEDRAEDIQVRDFLLLAWLAILETVGSYFKEGNGIKYRNKKRLKSGYVTRLDGEWQQQRFGHDQPAFVTSKLRHQLVTMLSDVGAWRQGNWTGQSVTAGSALDMDTIVGGETFDSIVFSPPYANRFDYFESLKVELWFGGFVQSYDDLNAYRKKSLRSHLGADLKKESAELGPLEDLLALMDQESSSWRMGVPTALRGYFDDMYNVLRRCRTLLPDGKCHVVVGNSAFAGAIIPTDSLIASLGLKAGFSKAKIVVVRHLTVAPQQRTLLKGRESYMRESVVILQ